MISKIWRSKDECYIKDLLPTHSSIRDHHQINQMCDFIENGGEFSKESLRKFKKGRTDLIDLIVFEDDQIYIRDGHHRTLSRHLTGYETLLPNEYRIRRFRYEQFMSPNIKAGWVTPFDPRTELRKTDLTEWKKEIATVIAAKTIDVPEYIQENRHKFVLPRNKIRHIEDLAGRDTVNTDMAYAIRPKGEESWHSD